MTTVKLITIAYFASQYHSGQDSRGYRLMCAVQRRLRRKGCSTLLTCIHDHPQFVERTELYKHLVVNYAGKM